jgi:hypothetical protein
VTFVDVLIDTVLGTLGLFAQFLLELGERLTVQSHVRQLAKYVKVMDGVEFVLD